MNLSFTKKKPALFFSIALMLTALVSNGQIGMSPWKFSNPRQFGFTVLDVSFLDDNNGIAVGSWGGIAKTTDAGITWKYAAFTFTGGDNMIQKAYFNSVQYVTSTIAYAVGDQGLFAKSTDGGLNWAAMNNPLFSDSKSIYGLHFINKDTGYIGGQPNSSNPAPKLYFTKDGGSTWDSISAPMGPKTRIGYVANPNVAPIITDVNAGQKEIHKIIFVNDSTGYIVGSGATYVPYTTETGDIYETGAASACLVWKFSKGVLTDYSISKERTGYEGIAYLPVDDQTLYNPLDPAQQTIKAVHAINDSLILVASFNNAIVVRISTGVNDSTENIAVPGTYDRGKYEMLNYPYPPQGAPSIPVDQVLLSSNFYTLKKAADGTILMNSGNGQIAMTKDSGRTWSMERVIPEGIYHSYNDIYALDITPNGKIFAMGANGVAFDSTAGSPWKSSSDYKSVTLNGSYSRIEFLDCNNAVAVGGGQITTTTDGGNIWHDKVRLDFVNSYIYITGMSYVDPTHLVIGHSQGFIYNSPDQGTTLDPIFADPYFDPNWGGGMISDLATSGTDSIWAFGYRWGASERTMLFRSFNAGATWDTIKAWPLDDNAPQMYRVKFSTSQIGYAVGNKGLIYKTTDAGATWADISPEPALNADITYADVQVLDNNTIFVVGNGYPRQVVYKSLDGGNNWTEITPVIPDLFMGYYNAMLMHDANNGYIILGGSILITNDGGTSWRADHAPSSGLNCAAFTNRTVPAGTPFANRKLFIGTITFGFGSTPGGHILEYGDPTKVDISTTDIITDANCTQANAGAITLNAAGGIAPYTYSIDGINFQSSNIFTGLTQGEKTITIKDAQCGITTKKITVGFANNLTVTTNITDTTVCSGAPVQLIATSAGTTYSWSPAAGLSDAAISNPVATANNNTVYTVTATLGSCTKTADVNFIIKASPAVFAGGDKTIVEGESVQLNGSGTNTASILWTPAATLTNANTFTPIAKPSVTTTYTLTVKDNNNCTSTDDAIVTVLPYCVKVMNAFTPNGDGINDKWLVTNGNACTTQVIAKVYNRYGSLVYSNENYQNNWDGTYKGKPVPDGTYYYVLSYRLINNKQVSLKGDVTILR